VTYYAYFKNPNTNTPITGLACFWDSLIKASNGADFTPQPSITEIGDGFYHFDITPTEDLLGRINGGNNLPTSYRYTEIVVSPDDAPATGGTTDVTTLLNRITADRATLLDNLANLDRAITAIPDPTANVTAIKAKTDNLPGSPAAVGSAMTLAANQSVQNVTGTIPAVTLAASQPNYAPAKATDITATDLTGIARTTDVTAARDAVVFALPAAPNNTAIAAIKTKTDNLPTAPAAAGDITTAQTAIISALPTAPDNAAIHAIDARLPAAPAAVTDVQVTVPGSALTPTEHDQLMAIPTSTSGTSGLATADQVAALPQAILDTQENGYPIRALIGQLAPRTGNTLSPIATFPVPSKPGYCNVIADMLSFGIEPRPGIRLTATVLTPAAVVNGYIIDGEGPWSVETDATGRATLPLPQGIVWLVTFPPMRMTAEIDTTNRDVISLAQIITS
jgi:hypothetical protein